MINRDLPGFTAEVSLHKSSHKYHSARDLNDFNSDKSFIPQAMPSAFGRIGLLSTGWIWSDNCDYWCSFIFQYCTMGCFLQNSWPDDERGDWLKGNCWEQCGDIYDSCIRGCLE
jgi:hypothetical protein